MNRNELYGVLYAVASAILMALTALVLRYTQAPLWTTVFFRFALGALIIGFFTKGSGTEISIRSIRRHFVRVLCGVFNIACYFYMIRYLSILNAVTLINTAPLFLPIVVFFTLKKVMQKLRIMALIIGFIGVAIILRPSGNIEVFPAVIGLFGALAVAIFRVLTRKISSQESTHSLLTHYFLFATAISFFPMVYNWEPIQNRIVWVYLLVLGGMSLLMQFSLTRALTLTHSSKVSAINYLSVPFGGLLGFAFFHEVPSFWVLIGTALIVASGVITILSKKESVSK